MKETLHGEIRSILTEGGDALTKALCYLKTFSVHFTGSWTVYFLLCTKS